MKANNILKALVIFFAASLAACNKEEIFPDPIYASITFSANTVDPLEFNLFLGDTLESKLSNTISTSKVCKLDPVNYDLPLRIEGATDKVLYTNTPFVPQMGTRAAHYCTVFQTKAGEAPFIVLPPADEPKPQTGFCKLRIITRDEALPATLKMFFYRRGETVPMDSCIVKRYEFSDWATLNVSDPSKRLEYTAYDMETGSQYATRKRFAFGVGDASDGGLDIICISSSGSNDVLREKLY